MKTPTLQSQYKHWPLILRLMQRRRELETQKNIESFFKFIERKFLPSIERIEDLKEQSRKERNRIAIQCFLSHYAGQDLIDYQYEGKCLEQLVW